MKSTDDRWSITGKCEEVSGRIGATSSSLMGEQLTLRDTVAIVRQEVGGTTPVVGAVTVVGGACWVTRSGKTRERKLPS